VVRRLNRAVPFTPSPILVGDEPHHERPGIATCLDAKTGKPYWVARIEGSQSASPIYVDGRIYFLGEEGVATVIAPGRTFQVLAKNTLDGATLASIAVSGGSFYIRTMTHLYKIANHEAMKVASIVGRALSGPPYHRDRLHCKTSARAQT
jgi:hypothetical protein